MKSLSAWITLAVACAATAAVSAQTASSAGRPPNWWSEAGGENGPERIVWAAQKTPETPYTGVNKPIWHLADILKSHQGQARWEEKVVLTRDFDGRYVQMAPGDKSKCLFYADDRVFGWVYSGALKMTIDGQAPKVLSKGWAFNVAPRLSYCIETVGGEPVVYYRTTPAGQVPSYPDSETPTPIPGYTYVKTKITSTGGYDSFNVPFFNVTEYGDSKRTGERFLYDGHTSSNLNIGGSITELPPATNWGHWHANMVELWVNVYGNVCALISGVGVVHGELGDVINANEERWHRATSCANTGKSIRMAMTPRSKEGQVHYFQVDQRPGQDAATRIVPTPGIPSTGFAGLDNYRASRVGVFADDFGQLARYRADNTALAAGAAARDRVVFFGDSITDAWKLPTYFAGKPYVNRGIGGQTTPQMLVRFRQDVIDLGPKAVVILAGTNDIAGNTGPMRDEDIEADLATMIELATSHAIAPIVASILPVHNYTPRSQDFFAQRPGRRILDVNRWLQDYCATHKIVYLDYFSAMVDAGGLLRKELADDGLHPNDAGYKIMASLAEAAIGKATAGR